MEETIKGRVILKNLRRRVEMVKEIILTYGRTRGATELAEKHGVSRQRIQQVAAALRKKGIDIPLIKQRYRKAIDIAIEEWQTENKKTN